MFCQENTDQIHEQTKPSEALTELEAAVLEMIQKNPELTIEDAVSALYYSTSTVKRAFVSLRKKGYIHHVGPNKRGYWEVQ